MKIDFCCRQCFQSPTVRRAIKDFNLKGECGYCGAKRTYVARPLQLRSLFEPLVGHYEPLEPDVHFSSHGIRDALDFDSLTSMMDERWGIFSTQLDERERDRLMDDIWVRNHREQDGIYDASPSEPWASRDDRIWDSTPEQIWRWFADAVKAGYDDEIDNDESGDLVRPETWVGHSIQRMNAIKIITPRTRLYRGRPGPDELNPTQPWPSSGMHAPPADRATIGRANAANQPMFYCAFEKETAVVESGRIPGTVVSLRQVAALENLRLVDLTKFHGETDPFKVHDPEDNDWHSRLLFQLSEELSRPVSSGDAHIDYIPTQRLAAAIRTAGYDGICYQSSLRKGGLNIVIFNPSKMRVFKRGLTTSLATVPPAPVSLAAEFEKLLNEGP